MADFEDDKDLMVNVTAAMGMEKIMDYKLDTTDWLDEVMHRIFINLARYSVSAFFVIWGLWFSIHDSSSKLLLIYNFPISRNPRFRVSSFLPFMNLHNLSFS